MPANAALASIRCDVPPYRLSGQVYGVLLNHRSAIAALGGAVNLPPYKAAPQAPVLYIKPRNTLAVSGDAVTIPAGTEDLEVAACLGVVIGRTACHLAEAQALEHVAGYLIVNDVSIAHPNYYRPAIRFKARDGFCPLGPAVTARAAVPDPNTLVIRTFVDDMLVQTSDMADLVRPIGQLLSDVTEFMTLAPGDVLAVGAAAPAPRVRAGQRVEIEIEGLGRLSSRFVSAVV